MVGDSVAEFGVVVAGERERPTGPAALARVRPGSPGFGARDALAGLEGRGPSAPGPTSGARRNWSQSSGGAWV